jgi:isopentenyl phosphate kinase
MTKVLKIGGSILTDKTVGLTARPAAIQAVAEEIACYPKDLVLVHGAGSFGHFPAKKYGLPQNFSPEGLRVTHNSVTKLNDLVVEALARAGAFPMPIHPFSCLVLRDGRIDRFPLDPIKEMLRDGLMPVLHGDVAMDINLKSGIVSGDQLVPYIAKNLQAKVVAIGSNVDGVLFSGKPLAEISRQFLSSMESSLGGSAGVDVTGGMKGKIMELLDLADCGIDSVIFNAAKEGNIGLAIKGEPVGTRIRRAK